MKQIGIIFLLIVSQGFCQWEYNINDAKKSIEAIGKIEFNVRLQDTIAMKLSNSRRLGLDFSIQGKYFKSEEIVRDQLLRKNDDPELWLLLSEIQRNSQNIVGYHQSRAEYFLLLGQDEKALNQLEFALQLTQNNFQVSESIMTKIVEIKRELSGSRGL